MLKKLWALGLLAAACLAASAAQATTTLHIEWMRGDYVYSTENVTSSGVSAQSGVMPDTGGQAGKARITVLTGAAVVLHGSNPTATQTNGIRLEAGRDPYTITVMPGEKVAAIEATDAPFAGGLASNTGVAAVTGTFAATGQSASFTPIAGREFNVTLRGTFVATVQLERSFDGGTNWHPITAAGTQLYVWTAPASETAEEPQYGVLYRLNDTAYTSGTVTYRISQ